MRMSAAKNSWLRITVMVAFAVIVFVVTRYFLHESYFEALKDSYAPAIVQPTTPK
jgi:hypothetical protein